MGNKGGAKSKWTKRSIDAEIEQLKPRSEDDIVAVKPRRRGRPKQYETIKTNLDLTEEFIDQLDRVAQTYGLNRQALIKHFILNGLQEHYRVESLRKA